MAQRRMFNRTVTESDAFTDMPLTAQALYFHLGMTTDDDGFVNSPKRVQRCIGAAVDDLNLLAAKGFVIPFESGVVVVRHWKLHNCTQKDRYHATICRKEMAAVAELPDKTYALLGPDADGCLYELPGPGGAAALSLPAAEADPSCIQPGNEMDPQSSQAKASPEKGSLSNASSADAPLAEAVIGYLNKMANRSFHASTNRTVSLVNARAAEGYGLEDFRRVIDAKVRQWGGDERMSKFLRPETLFGDKFESYVNEGKVRPSDYGEYDF